MKIAVRYQSRGGNSRVVAEQIAKTAGATAEPISVPTDDRPDILFVGGGVYMWTIDDALRDYLKTLTPDSAGTVVVFTTGGGMDKTKTAVEVLKSNGVNVCEHSLSVLFGVKNHTGFGGSNEKARLSEHQINNINAFVEQVIKGVGL